MNANIIIKHKIKIKIKIKNLRRDDNILIDIIKYMDINILIKS